MDDLLIIPSEIVNGMVKVHETYINIATILFFKDRPWLVFECRTLHRFHKIHVLYMTIDTGVPQNTRVVYDN